jgi:hypothetical protein
MCRELLKTVVRIGTSGRIEKSADSQLLPRVVACLGCVLCIRRVWAELKRFTTSKPGATLNRREEPLRRAGTGEV